MAHPETPESKPGDYSWVVIVVLGVAMLCCTLALYLGIPKEHSYSVDSEGLQKMCESYRSAAQKQDWLRAYVLRAELFTIMRKAKIARPCSVYENDPNLEFRARALYRSTAEYETARDRTHEELRAEGLCSELLLHEPH